MKWQKRLVAMQLTGAGISAFTIYVTRRLRKQANDNGFVRHTSLHPYVTHRSDSHRHGTVRIAIRDERYEAVQFGLMTAMQASAVLCTLLKRQKAGVLILTGLSTLVSGLTLMLRNEFVGKHDAFVAHNNDKAGIVVIGEAAVRPLRRGRRPFTRGDIPNERSAA